MIEMATPLFIAGRAVFKWAAVAVCTATALPVYALDPGECGTPEAMTDKLKAEGQRSAMMADQVMPGKKLQAVIFTTNQDSSVGYIMLSDRMSDERASKFCVQERLTDMRWHDARKKGIPAAAKLRSSNAEAEKRCGELRKLGKITERNACEPLNVILEDRGRIGIRPVVQGFVVEKGPDGVFKKTGTLMTVIANVTGEVMIHEGRETSGIAGAMIYSSLPDGASVISEVLGFAKYTEHGLTLLP